MPPAWTSGTPCFRMMQGFGVHTFRLVDAGGRGTFVKFHWKPKLGKHSLVWDETQKVAGKDPDFNRRDLWEAIESGAFPEYELGLQLVPEEDEHAFDFDLLDATKIIPEEQVPVRPVGRLVLNRNPDNFFAETEQVAFHLANVVPGIDFTNDPLLQGRLFSYLDTQLIRLGGPNFLQIPVNQPIVGVHDHHREGYHQMLIHKGRAAYHQMLIHKGRAAYHPNSLDGGLPGPAGDRGYTHHQERVDGHKIRKRSESFSDHYGQATLFWNSMADWEREHIIAAFRFELGKLDARHVQEGVVRNLNEVDHDLAVRVAESIGVDAPGQPSIPNHGRSSPALSMAHEPADTIATRKIAFLVADGVDAAHVQCVLSELTGKGAVCEVLAAYGGAVRGAGGEKVTVTMPLPTTASVLFDAVVVPGGEESVRALAEDGDAVHFVTEAYKHSKAIGAIDTGALLLEPAHVTADQGQGVITSSGGDLGEFLASFTAAVAAHRHHRRSTRQVPA
jgi:catalase